MSDKRYLGNIITPTPTAPAGPYQDDAAKGVWSLQEAYTYIKAGTWPTAGKVSFGNAVTFSASTGSSYTTYTVPAGVTVLRVKCWGAGGGAADNESSSVLSYGGGGGFAQSDISVTPGETLRVYVATAGQNSTGTYYARGASGGGYSAVFRDSTPLVIAAGGGGGAYASGRSGYNYSAGGNGGGLTGEDGETYTISGTTYNGGQGGTQSAGGSSVCSTGSVSCSVAGSSLQGGAGGSLDTINSLSGGDPGGGASGGYSTAGALRNAGGGGGGGGYYGGSGGSGSLSNNQARAAGGGGGSSYTSGTNNQTSNGLAYPSAVKSSDVDYVGTAARGGVSGPTQVSPGIGLVVLRYSS